MKSLVEGFSNSCNVRLAGWGPRDPSHIRLETPSDVASSHIQWYSFTFSFSLSSERHMYYLFTFEFSPPISEVALVIGCDIACTATRTRVFKLGS